MPDTVLSARDRALGKVKFLSQGDGILLSSVCVCAEDINKCKQVKYYICTYNFK